MNNVLNEDQRDALQELMNISMGRAANALARLIGTKVSLSIPRIVAVTPEEFNQILSNKQSCYTRQSFLGGVKGEVLTILSEQGCCSIAELMEFELPLNEDSHNELLLELANILAGACLTGFSEQLDLNTKLSMPTVFVPEKRLQTQANWASTLLMEVEFKVEASHFDSRVVICLESLSVDTLLTSLGALLE